MKDNYNKIFELISPAGSDDDFINEVVRKADEKIMKKSMMNMYALSAALVMAIAIGAVGVYAFGALDNSMIAPSTSGESGFTATNAPVLTDTSEKPVNPVIDPNNPFNWKVVENTFDNLEVSLVDIWGDTRTMYAEFEMSIPGWDIPDIDNFHYNFPGISERGFTPVREEVIKEWEANTGIRVSGFGSLEVRNGKVYGIGQISLSDTSLFIGEEFKFEILQYCDKAREQRIRELDGTEHYNIDVERNIAESVFTATFTANYTPKEFTVFDFSDDNNRRISNGTVEKIEISHYEIAIDFIFDEDVYFNCDCASTTKDHDDDCSAWNNRFFDRGMALKFTDGRVEAFIDDYNGKSVPQYIQSGRFSGCNDGGSYSMAAINIPNELYKPLDISTIEAIIIDGVEFKLD
jgi:hypothetical protein